VSRVLQCDRGWHREFVHARSQPGESGCPYFHSSLCVDPSGDGRRGDEPTDDVLLIIVGCIVDAQDFVEAETGVETRVV